VTRVGLVIPALDEERALPLVLAELPPGRVDIVVVVDNGSRDRTAEVARAAGAWVVREPRRGYGSACQAGLAALFGEHADPAQRVPRPLDRDDVVVFLDADHSDFPADLPDLLAPILDDSADFVVGSRVLGGAGLRAMLPQAWFGNRLACLLMRVFFGLRATDLGPFRAIRAGALRDLALVDLDFGWTVEMQLKAHVAGLRTREVAVRYRPRVGTSKITGTLSGTLRAGWKILSWILGWRWRLRRPRP
jgi:glycosyltransferase involved in cell wall biosynthesis